MSYLEPWVLARLVAGFVAAALFVHAAWVGLRVLRFFHVQSTAEGQLALERQAELGAASARVGAGVQLLALLLSLLAADQLTTSVRGAMCGYGVVHAVEAGPWSVIVSLAAAIGAGAQLELLALDRRVRGLGLVRPLAGTALVLAALSLCDLGMAAAWLGGLDFTVVSSCCSSGLDGGVAGAVAQGAGGHGQALVGLAGLAAVALAAAGAWAGQRRPGRRSLLVAGALGLVALPAAIGAVVLEVAPHVYEVPQHRCPYCLFKLDALGIGYPLFGAIVLAAAWSLGGVLGALLLPSGSEGELPAAARPLLHRVTQAWVVALVVGLFPVIRYLVLAGQLL